MIVIVLDKELRDKTAMHLTKLVNCIKSCGVSFNVWESDTNTSCHEWTSLTGKSKRKVQIHLILVTFIIHVHCVYQLLPSNMKDIPLPSALLPTVVKLWEVLCAVSQITCQQMTSFLCWHTDFEDLYSILSNESPPQNASNQFHQKVSLASVQI